MVSNKNKSLKFCQSSVYGNIHLFNIEYHLGICEILITSDFSINFHRAT